MSKIISVWGGDGSGKTTLSMKIAKELSKKKNVIIVFLNKNNPSIPYLFSEEIEDYVSVGEILTKVSLVKKDVEKSIKNIKNNKNLGVIGYKNKENYKTYPEILEDRIYDFYVYLKQLSDYIIIDTTSDLKVIENQISLKIADKVIRVITENPKDICYFNSNLSLLEDKSYNTKNHVKVLNKKEYESNKNSLKNFYGTFAYEFEKLKTVEMEMINGEVGEKTKDKVFNKELKRMIEQITEEDRDEEIREGKKKKKIFKKKEKVEEDRDEKIKEGKKKKFFKKQEKVEEDKKRKVADEILRKHREEREKNGTI